MKKSAAIFSAIGTMLLLASTVFAQESDWDKPMAAIEDDGGGGATPKTFQVVVEVTVDASKTNGDPWDVGGGAPDVVVTVRSSRDGRVLKGEKHEDRGTFSETLGNLELAKGDTLSFTLVDKDAMADDSIGSVVIDAKSGTSQARAGASRIKVTLKAAK